jgi:hypothetical protein
MEQLIQEQGLPAKMLICLSAHNGAKESSVAHRLVSLDLSSGGEPTRRRDLAQIDVSVNLRWQDASETGTARKRVLPGSIKKAASATPACPQ